MVDKNRGSAKTLNIVPLPGLLLQLSYHIVGAAGIDQRGFKPCQFSLDLHDWPPENHVSDCLSYNAKPLSCKVDNKFHLEDAGTCFSANARHNWYLCMAARH